jgi:hypothetical protein
MKDITSTSFGLIIAFVLPGLAVFYSLSYFSAVVAQLFSTFQTAQSNVGLVFLVFAGALTIGLEITVLRWIAFEKWWCGSKSLPPKLFQQLSANEHSLAAFRTAIEEQYRYHQFWGGMCFSIPVFAIGYLYSNWATLSRIQAIVVILLFLVIEVATWTAAVVAFERYVDRGSQILKG